MAKKNNRFPKEGDTVFLITEKKHVAMVLNEIFIEDGIKKGRCTYSKTIKVDDDFKNTIEEGIFLYKFLTLDKPITPTTIYLK